MLSSPTSLLGAAHVLPCLPGTRLPPRPLPAGRKLWDREIQGLCCPPGPTEPSPKRLGAPMHHGVGLCMAMVLCGKGAGTGRGQQGCCISLGMTANGHSVAKPPGGGCSWADDDPHHPHPKA